jgi:hypothetical protein
VKPGGVEKARFHGVFADRGNISTIYIGVFSEVFLHAPIADARFLRKLRGFSSGVFARVFFSIR